MAQLGRDVAANPQLRLKPKMKKVRAAYSAVVDSVTTENVGAILRGRTRPDEYLALTAHYDHLGIRNGQIYNGADDDGSGTATVLEMARVFALSAQDEAGPECSILFLCFTGEEKGLLGSEYYSNNPAVPMEKTTADINTDMIGRIDTAQKGREDYVYLIGADKISHRLDEITRETNQACCKLKLDYTYNAETHPDRFYYRSDHYNFARKGVPVAFYFTGVHEDYHQPGDDTEKILFPKMASIARLIFQTAWGVSYEKGMLPRVK